MRRLPLRGAVLLTLGLLMIAGVAPSYAQFNVLYNFGAGGNSDPCQPVNSGIIAQGQDGNLYTTAPSCGSNDGGAAFQMTPAGAFRLVYTFSAGGGAIFYPLGGLTLDPASGNFYGTTEGGGTVDDGTLFNLTPTGTLNVLHSFTGNADGYTANAPPIIGTDGNLYGTSRRGGNFVACVGTGCGVVYKMTTSGTLIWSYEFDITHGLYPYAPLVQGSDGNFYGTTQEGGTNGVASGTVFKITPDGKLTVLHNFCSKPGCADGQYPQSPLIQGNDGDFYGTTTLGGTNGAGEVFKITPTGTLTVVHSMSSAADGANPYAGLVQASDGNFYGADQAGGTHGAGTLFKLTPTGIYSVIYNFDGTTGAQPFVALVQHTNGILYGDTFEGGTGSQVNCSAGTCGVFYSYNAGLKAFIKLLPNTGNVGSQIGILGQGFNNTSVVKFNGVKATSITVVSSTCILAAVPVGTLDGYVTVTTGATTLKSVQKFFAHDSWGTGKPLPTPVRYPAGVGAIGSKIYVVGGTTTGSTIIATNQVYNTMTNSWTTAAPLPVALTDGTGAVVNGILYVIGGYNGTSVVNTVYAYNPSTNSWTSKATMPTARSSIGSAVKSGLIYVIGGVNGDGVTRLTENESYNPATNTWASKAPLLVGKSEVSVGLAGTTILATDGYTTSGDTGDNEGYNATTNIWKGLASDPTPRHDSCYGVINGLMYIAGGGLSPMNTNESYNVTSNSWTGLSPIPVATTAPGSATYNGQLFCFGGGDSTLPTGGNFYNNVQIYQP